MKGLRERFVVALVMVAAFVLGAVAGWAEDDASGA